MSAEPPVRLVAASVAVGVEDSPAGPVTAPPAIADTSTTGSALDPLPLADALHRMQFGVIVCAENGRPSFINVFAKRLLDKGDGLRAGEMGLEADRASDTRALRDAIRIAARSETRLSAMLLLARSGVARPLIAYVPVTSYRVGQATHATVFICDPNHSPVIEPALLTRLFGFTRTESTVALLLMSGMTIERAAEHLYLSEHTVRTHQKRLLVKTDTGRQAELMRLLLLCSGQVTLG